MKAMEGSIVGLKAPFSWLGTFEASASQAFMSRGWTNPSAEQKRSANRHRRQSPSTGHQKDQRRHRPRCIRLSRDGLRAGRSHQETFQTRRGRAAHVATAATGAAPTTDAATPSGEIGSSDAKRDARIGEQKKKTGTYRQGWLTGLPKCEEVEAGSENSSGQRQRPRRERERPVTGPRAREAARQTAQTGDRGEARRRCCCGCYAISTGQD